MSHQVGQDAPSGSKWLTLQVPTPRAWAHTIQHPHTYIIFLGAPPEVGPSSIAGNVEDSNSLETGEWDGSPVTLSSRKAGKGEDTRGHPGPSAAGLSPREPQGPRALCAVRTPGSPAPPQPREAPCSPPAGPSAPGSCRFGAAALWCRERRTTSCSWSCSWRRRAKADGGPGLLYTLTSFPQGGSEHKAAWLGTLVTAGSHVTEPVLTVRLCKIYLKRQI